MICDQALPPKYQKLLYDVEMKIKEAEEKCELLRGGQFAQKTKR